MALYSDKAGVFRVNAKSPKAGDGFTQFGRAMTELNIDVICANTPAAKGRVERAHQTLQDRLVKELRLRGISTMDDANRYLPEFMDDYNRRFARVARNDHDAHRPLTERDHLDDIFTWQEQRRVTAQLTVHHKRTMYLLEPTPEAKAAAKKRVTVVEYEDGGVSIRFQGVTLAARPFHKDGCVTQGSIVENKLLSGALTEIRKRQQQKEQELVRSAKTKREKRIVARPLRRPVAAARTLKRPPCSMPTDDLSSHPPSLARQQTFPPIHRVLQAANRPAHCRPPAPRSPSRKRTSVLSRTTGHERLVLTSALIVLPMG